MKLTIVKFEDKNRGKTGQMTCFAEIGFEIFTIID